MSHTYAENPRILSARETLKQTNENISQAHSNFLPNLSASRSYGRTNTRTVEDRNSSGSVTRTDTLSLSQNIFNYSHIAQLKKADREVGAQRMRLQASEQDILLQAITSYIDVLKALNVIDLRHSNMKVMQAHLKSTKIQYELRRRTNTDLAQAKSRLAKGRADLASAQATYDKSRSKFMQVNGYYPQQLKMPSFKYKLPESPDEAQENALSDHPNVWAASLDVDAARAEISVKQGERAPNLALSGSVAKANTMNKSSANSDTLTSAVTLTLTVPLFQSGVEYSNVRTANTGLRQKLYDLDQARRTAKDNARQ
ncbi:MAG: TolC family protein, partial [Magnetovibrio sp.]|nr:TolC family protein [Magnetovibrio sp.]